MEGPGHDISLGLAIRGGRCWNCALGYVSSAS